jgi:acetylornithine deacetylase/succinyl-diaminopimelate desuccinylase-like protein
LDWRNVPGETADDVLAQLQPVLEACLAEVEGSQGELVLHTRHLRTYTGQTEVFPAVFPSFGLAADDKLVLKGQRVLANVLSRPVDVIIWRFATDGGYLVAAGVPTIGFGPAEAHTAHTVREHVPVEMLVEGMLGYVALALELGKEEE